jgi:hypothetical protein
MNDDNDNPDNPTENSSDNDNPTEITRVVLPEDTVTVPVHSLDYTFHHIDGQDVIGLVIGSQRTGTIEYLVTTTGAQHIGAHLMAMVADLDALRRAAE